MEWSRLARQRPVEAVRRLAILTALALATVVASAAPARADDLPDGSATATAIGVMIVIAAAFVAAGLGLVWSWKNGEYVEPEEIKYQMLAMVEDDPDFWEMGQHEDDEDYAEEERPLLARPAVR